MVGYQTLEGCGADPLRPEKTQQRKTDPGDVFNSNLWYGSIF